MSTLQKVHSPYVPVQVVGMSSSVSLLGLLGAEGGPSKVLLSSRPIYHHSPPHSCPQVCPSGLPLPTASHLVSGSLCSWSPGSGLQSPHSICSCSHWQPGPGLMELGNWFCCFPPGPCGAETAGQWHTRPSLGRAGFKPWLQLTVLRHNL